MKYFFYLLFFLLFFNSSFSQKYSIAKSVTSCDNIGFKEDISKIYFSVYLDTIYQIRAINIGDDSFDYKITMFNIETGKQLKCDTLQGIPISFIGLNDFLVLNGKMFITSDDRYISFNLSNMYETLHFFPTEVDPAKNPHPFDKCQALNDSLVLLYTIYNYHPLDGKAGIHLTVFNINTHQFGKYKFMNFPGIGVSHISGNWVTVVKGKAYVINPLSGRVITLDKNLSIIDSGRVKIFSEEDLSYNLSFQSRIDSIVDNETKFILGVASKYPKDSVQYHYKEYSSTVYAKDFISNTIREVRGKHTFINNIFTSDNSLIVLSVSSPGYAIKYRDVYFYSPAKKKIVKQYLHLLCSHNDTLVKPEDFYTINFAFGKPFFPYIHDNCVYYPSLYALSSFKEGSYDDFSLKLLSETKKSGFKWNVIKYVLK
jgi:hypothetical protein